MLSNQYKQVYTKRVHFDTFSKILNNAYSYPRRMFRELVREVCKGQGYKVTDIPFVNVIKNPALKIRNLSQYEAAVQSLIDSFTEKDWLDLFEHGIINKFGYPITYEFSQVVDKAPQRFMVLLKRPPKKTTLDDSPLSQLFLFGDELVKEVFGSDYVLSKISILLSNPDAREQVRHIDYEATLESSDFAIIVPFKFNGNVSIWPFSQHAVRASQLVKDSEPDKRKHVSLIRDHLLSNRNFGIDFDSCQKKDVLIGPNEMLVLGGNTVHAGAKNNMFCPTYRVHFYVTHISRKAPDNQTIVLDPVVWDMTRNGARSHNILFDECDTFDDYRKMRAEEKALLAVDKIPPNVATKKRGRGRPPKVQQLAKLLRQAKGGRGRPRKVPDVSQLIQQAKRGRGRPRKVD